MKKSGAIASIAVTMVVFAGCASTPTPTATATPAAAVPQSTTSTAQPTSVAATPSQTATPAIVKPASTAVYFDFDRYDVKDQYTGVVRSNADYLTKTAGAVELDGNCDERGSREYNMALGQKRADAVKKALTVLGVKGERVETISFGEDKPKATGHDEAAWAENRRVDFVSKSK